jgi:phosphatidate cytidylyltransferase
VDEGDEDGYEPEKDSFAEPVTERVRIIGAEAVGTVPATAAPTTAPGPSGATTPSSGAAAYPDEARGPVAPPESRSRLATDDDIEVGASTGLDQRSSVPAWLDDADDDFEETPVSTDLPHWTDPPTGQVPAVLERRTETDAEHGDWSASGDAGPAWREHRHEWDDSAFDPSLLADETTRVGALEEVPLEERQPWEFDDLSTPAEVPTSWDSSPERGSDVGSDDPSDDEGAVLSGSRPSAFTNGTETDDPLAPPGARIRSASGVPSISSSPLRGSPDPLSPAAAIPGARGRARRGPTTEPAAKSGRNVPLSIATGLGFAAVALICFALGSVATLALSTVVVILAAAEAYAALRRSGSHPATLLGLVATGAAMVTAYVKGVSALPLVLVLLIITSMIWYLVGAERGSPVAGISSTVLGFAWVGLLGSYAGLLLAPSQYPDRHGVAFLFGAAVATVAADVGALAIGGWLGRHPLAPNVSPHKTWEGLAGGTLFAVLASAAVTGSMHPWTPAKAAVLGLVVAVLAPVGDLCESLIKRDLKLKDMGNLLPGHGGVLDRVDGLLFVLPATYYLVRVLHLG